MKLSVFCSLPGCRRFTRHSSGRCHDHRGVSVSTQAPPLPVPVIAEPKLTYDESIGRWRKPDGEPVWEIGSIGEGYRAEHTDDGDFHEEWLDDNGAHHRSDGPAMLHTRPDGTVIYAAHYEHGKSHRVGGACTTAWRKDGTRKGEMWWIHGDGHRVGGAAEVYFREDDSIEQEVWWLRGKSLELREYAKAMTNYTADELREGLAESSFAPLLDDGGDPHLIFGALAEGVQTHEGIRLVLNGTPPEWARAFEESSS